MPAPKITANTITRRLSFEESARNMLVGTTDNKPASSAAPAAMESCGLRASSISTRYGRAAKSVPMRSVVV